MYKIFAGRNKTLLLLSTFFFFQERKKKSKTGTLRTLSTVVTLLATQT